MIVEVLPFKPRDVVTKRPQDGGQYQIIVDGSRVGFIGYHDGARPLLHVKVSPLELKEITRQVSEQLDSQIVGSARCVTDPPPEQEKKPVPYDDFD